MLYLISSPLLPLESVVTCLSYSPNGNHIAVGLQSGDVKVLNSTTGASLFMLRQQVTNLLLTFSNLTSLVAVFMHLTQGAVAGVSALAYSQDGSLLATGHRDGCIQLWKSM